MFAAEQNYYGLQFYIQELSSLDKHKASRLLKRFPLSAVSFYLAQESQRQATIVKCTYKADTVSVQHVFICNSGVFRNNLLSETLGGWDVC